MRRRAAAFVLVALLLVMTARVILGDRSAVAELRAVPAGRADARVDRAVTQADVAELGRTVEQSVAYVEDLFQHKFTEPPKLVVFGDAASFSSGLAGLFNYSESDAARSASSYGGIYDHATATIAVNLQTIAADDRTATFDHELTHYIMRELTAGRQLPAWFEEGIATLSERHLGADRWPDEDALVGRAIGAEGRVGLAQLETLADWHGAYPRFGQSLYLYAATAASQMRFRAGWPGMLALLSEVAAGRPFAEAYRAASGESVADLDLRIHEDRAPRLIARPRRGGDAQYTLFSGAPLTEEKVTIGGQSTYVVTFTVRTDDLGIYRGSFGSTAPQGVYQVGVAGARVDLTIEHR